MTRRIRIIKRRITINIIITIGVRRRSRGGRRRRRTQTIPIKRIRIIR